MSEEEKTSMVTPTGRIVFLKNLFEVNDKGRYKATLLLDKGQDLSKLKKLLMDTAKSKFDDKVIKSKKFKWGMKSPDEEGIEQYDFFDENTLILNTSTKFEVEVKSAAKQHDGKYEDLIEGDLKAGDYCRFLISAFAWENADEGMNRGVSLNLIAVQKIKEGEALYARVASDSMFDETALDVAAETTEAATPEAAATEEAAESYEW